MHHVLDVMPEGSGGKYIFSSFTPHLRLWSNDLSLLITKKKQ